MHIVTKITLAIGGVLLVGSIIVMISGGQSFMGDFSENPNGTEKWSGTAPTTYQDDFSPFGMYYVFIEEGKTVDIAVTGENDTNLFNPCSEYDSCDMYSWPGYSYVGQLSFAEESPQEIEFTGEGKVLVREQVIDFGGAMAFTGGFFGICCAVLLLGLGVIFIFVLDDDKAQPVIMMQQPGGGIHPMVQQGTVDPHTNQQIHGQYGAAQMGYAQTGMVQPTQFQPAQPQPTQFQPAQPQPTQFQPAQPQPAQPQPAQPQPTQPQPTQPQPTQPQPTQPTGFSQSVFNPQDETKQ